MGLSIQFILALKLLLIILEKTKTDIADKAKPRASVGRKATGSPGQLGYRSKRNFAAPGLHCNTGFLFDPGFLGKQYLEKRRC